MDIYLPEAIRGHGYCEDAAVYAKHLQARMIPTWVLTQRFFDKQRNANVTYHELCPNTPLLVFNHFWEDVRNDRTWPATKPLYLMPNIEMYELEAHHYREVDVILCKTVICAQSLIKWFDQEGNPRMTQVLYTRFTSSDIATSALDAGRMEMEDDNWPEREKDFNNVSFTHTVERVEHFYESSYGYKTIYGNRILASTNVNLHSGMLDAVAFGTIIANTAFFLCTSVMEGYGHYINNARAAGGLVVTIDVPPMNELITPSSGILVQSSRRSSQEEFLGGSSPKEGAFRDVPGFIASFNGNAVCKAVDHLIKDVDSAKRRQAAKRARQQFFYDTAFFAKKMQTLRDTLQPASINKRLHSQEEGRLQNTEFIVMASSKTFCVKS